MTPEQFKITAGQITTAVSRVLVGQDEALEHVLVALFSGGHALLEGVPGVGKTLLVRALAQVLGCQWSRIQFTPDLMPSDVTGGNVFNQKTEAFDFLPGPVFTQLLLADEINRAPAKTQSALLEAMQEGNVTADGVTRDLPQPFVVIATQNPVESQGTYPLPEAQLDRFLVKIDVGHSPKSVEKLILNNELAGVDASDLAGAGLVPVTSPESILQMRAATKSVRVDDGLLDYITEIVERTRSHGSIYLGASTRGSLGLLRASRTRAILSGRDFVVPDDVKSLAPAVLAHRVILHPDAEFEGATARGCIEGILREVPVPHSAA